MEGIVGVIVVVCLIVGVCIAIARVKKLKDDRKEERRREEERLKPRRATSVTPPSTTPKAPTAPAKSKNIDPFPSYKTDPFAESVALASSGTLSPAQLNEWLLDFAAAEKSNVGRPAPKKDSPVFARWLLASGFSYRLTRKLRGYTPQNGLPCAAMEYKRKPASVSSILRNDKFAVLPPEHKISTRLYVPPQHACFDSLPQKNAAASATYTSFYKGKD